jgi:hypothetical protein
MLMDKSTLLDNIIRYIYKETDKDENKRIKHTLYQNPELRQEFKCFKETCKYLNCLNVKPCKELINSILNYSVKIRNFGQSELEEKSVMSAQSSIN